MQQPNITPHGDRLASALLGLAEEFLKHGHSTADLHGTQGISTPFSTASQSDWAEAVRHWNENGRGLIVDLEKRPCPSCSSADHRYLFQSYDGYPYVECTVCGCWYVPLKVEADLFERFFERCPPALQVLQRTFQDRQSTASVQSNLERIGGYLDAITPLLGKKHGLSYLDMGCGLGHSLQAAHVRGYVATGVDSSRECVALAANNGLDVFHVSDDRFREQRFRLISFWESLEHMVDPATVLQESFERLEPRGLLAFTIPNQNSPLVRTQRGDCSFINGGYDTPGHINLFSPANIENLLGRSGYRLLALDGQYGLNLGELISYLLGKQGGAYTMLRNEVPDNGLSEQMNLLLRSIGPAFALIERVSLMSPILFGFACRTQDFGDFRQPLAEFHEARRQQIRAEIERIKPVSSDVPELQRQLHTAEEHIRQLEDQLRVAHNPLRRLVRFLRGKLKPPKD